MSLQRLNEIAAVIRAAQRAVRRFADGKEMSLVTLDTAAAMGRLSDSLADLLGIDNTLKCDPAELFAGPRDKGDTARQPVVTCEAVRTALGPIFAGLKDIGMTDLGLHAAQDLLTIVKQAEEQHSF